MRPMFVGILAALLLPLAAWADEIHLGHGRRQDAFTDPTAAAAAAFKATIESASRRALVIHVFPDGQLGGEDDLIRLVEQGVIHAALVPADAVARRHSPLGVVRAPFLFADRAAAARAFDGAFGKALAGSVAAGTGMVVLGYADAGGFNLLTNSQRPVQGPEDVEGLRLRAVLGAPLRDALIAALGAEAVPVPAADEYAALEAGAIDAVDTTLPDLLARRLDHVQSFATLTDHAVVPTLLLYNKAAFDTLPPERQALLRTAATAAVTASRTLSTERQSSPTDGLPALKRRLEVTTLTDKQRAAFRTAVWAKVIEVTETALGPEGKRLLEAAR